MNAFSHPISVPAAHPYSGGNGVLDVLGNDGLPFMALRAFRIAQVPPGEFRANHAHRTCLQILWSVSGRWRARIEAKPGDVVVHELDEGRAGLLVPTGHWLSLTSTTRLDVLVVLCSDPYSEASYCRDRATWERERAERSRILAEAFAGPIKTAEHARACIGRVVVLLKDVDGHRAGDRFVVDWGGLGYPTFPSFNLHAVGSQTGNDWVEVATEFFRLESVDG